MKEQKHCRNCGEAGHNIKTCPQPRRRMRGTLRQQWRAVAKARGACAECGKPRGEDGGAYYCRACANNSAADTRRRYHRAKKAGLCPTCHQPIPKEQ